MSSAKVRVLCLALAVALLSGCSFGFLSSKKRLTDTKVVIVFTGSNNGELKPCG